MESGSQSWQSVHEGEDGERGRAEGRNVDPENCEDDFMSRFLDRQSRTPLILILTRWLVRQLRRVWAPLEGPVRSIIRFCLLVIGFSLTGVVVFVVIAVVFLVYRIPIAMILEGIVSLKQPPRLRQQQQQINDEVSHHPDIIYRLGSLYKRRRQKVAVRRRVKTLLAIVLLIVFICLGILKRRAMVVGFDLWKWMVLLGVFTCGRQISTLVLAGMYHVPGQIKDMAVVRRLENGEGYRIICYYVYWLTDPILTVFYSATLILIWLQCFFNKDKEEYLSYGTWTLVCLLVGSVLLLLKTAFLLNWSERNVYHLFSDRPTFVACT